MGLRQTVRNKLTLVTFLLLPLCASAANVQVNDFGAKGDGQSIDTGSIQRAIDAAAASGGTVAFKPGTYLSGALFLKSGVRFQVDEEVTIRGVHDLSAFPEMPTRVAGIEMNWPAALINVYEQSNVTISGKGVIDGDGKYWWTVIGRCGNSISRKGCAGRPITTAGACACCRYSNHPMSR